LYLINIPGIKRKNRELVSIFMQPPAKTQQGASQYGVMTVSCSPQMKGVIAIFTQ
jgi:hypothetical protein